MKEVASRRERHPLRLPRHLTFEKARLAIECTFVSSRHTAPKRNSAKSGSVEGQDEGRCRVSSYWKVDSPQPQPSATQGLSADQALTIRSLIHGRPGGRICIIWLDSGNYAVIRRCL
jgi:hypothetical protein